MKESFWKCARCGYENGTRRDACFRCGTSKGTRPNDEPAEPVKRGSVAAALRTTYPDRYCAMVSKRIIQESKEYLGADEHLVGVLLGRRQHMLGAGAQGALWATDQRLLWFVPGGLLSSPVTESYSYEKIAKVQFTPVLQGQLNIEFVGLQDLWVWYIDKKAGKQFADIVHKRLAGAREPKSIAPRTHPEKDLTSELERLAKLRAQGAISDEEFKAAKRRLLYL
jgi:hypothetical protein